MVFLNPVIVLVGLIIGSISDLRTREIPDLLSFSLIAVGFISGFVTSIFFSDYTYIANAILGFIAGTIIGFILFYTGQWGGGDTKIVMGIGALTGLSISEFAYGIPIFFVFIINAILIGAVYGLIWIFFLGIKNFKSVRLEVAKIRSKPENIKFRKYLFLAAIIAMALLMIFTGDLLISLSILFLASFLLIFFYASLFVKTIESVAMVKVIPVSKLTEGDWITGDVKLKGNKTFKPPHTGISMEDIKLLKKSGVKKVTVREGIPFVPSLLLAYIATLIFGNWILLLVGQL